MAGVLVRSWVFISFLFACAGFVCAEEQSEKLRDPTQPLGFVAQKATLPKLELQAVFIRGDIREAVINGKRVKIGETVAGAEVLTIDDKSVAYRRNGVIAKLSLRDSVIDRKRK